MSTTKNNRVLTEIELDRVAQQFRVLGEPMRLKILQLICMRPLTVGEIVTATGATQSNISKHLSVLASAEIIARQKDAQFVYYRLSDPLTMKLCELVHSQLFERS